MAFLELIELRKRYPDGTEAVKGIDFAADEGAFVVLLGPSGCGKTTTLRMIAGLELPTGGRIMLGGENVTNRRPAERDIGFVFQFYALYPHLSVEENIGFPLAAAGMGRAERRKVVGEIVERLGLKDLVKLHPRALSGGDQQRVSLARAMVRRPRAWLMDEPLGTLDADQRLAMRELLKEQQMAAKVTTVYVTHDQEEAMSLADQVVVMNAGLIQQSGTPREVYERPANLFVANFVGSPGMNFVKGRIDGGSFVMGEDRMDSGMLRDGPAVMGIRPEHAKIGGAGVVAGRVLVDEFLGSHRFVHVDTPWGKLIARAAAKDGRSVGEAVQVSFDREALNFFDPDGGARL